ncbi:MAG: FemAB family PEP-CTERM system-associated protein [Caldisericaceae bacterium]|nr:FemAB family PEP-CTERM system-associated protein [Caldisericaceae bacterium]
MQIKELKPNNFTQWDSFVDERPQGKIYHKTVWKEIFEKAFGRKTLYYFVENTNGQIEGILPLVHFHTFIAGKQLISLPYVNYGGPLWSNDSAKQLIFSKMQQLLMETNSDVLEIRYDKNDAFDLPVKTNKVTFSLDLPEHPDELLKSFKAKVRSQIKRPTKEGMYAKVGHLDLLDDFYYVFCRNMRDLGTPVYSKKIFKTILTLLPEQTHVVVIYSKTNLPVASAFLLGYKKQMEIPWASSLRKYNRFSPNMLLYWQVMQLAIEKGYRVFDFGRGTKDGGTYRFKKQWGGREVQLYWYYLLGANGELPEVAKENPKFQLAIKIWQKLPLWFTNIAGPPIVKKIS